MKPESSRRSFLAAAGLGLPAAGLAATPAPQSQLSEPQVRPVPAASAGLEYRTLGKTGLKVTSVGFGCMVTSDASVVEKAADLGINYFDTHRNYMNGNNERLVGAALKGKRKNLVLASKTHAPSKQQALADLDTSLKELGTDYLDIWFLHSKASAAEVTDDLIDAQQTARKAGKIRFMGVSTHKGQADVIGGMLQKGVFDVLLTAYNFTMEAQLDPMIEAASKAGLGVVAMKVMAGGFRRMKPGEKAYNTLKKDGALVAALKWCLKNPNVHTTIPGMTDMEQLDDNMKAMSVRFNSADEKLLAGHLRYIQPFYCRMCGQCDGACPKGLPVADMLRFVTYADGYGQFPLGRQNFAALPEDVKSVRCNLCPECPVACPYGVNVLGQLERAQDLFA